MKNLSCCFSESMAWRHKQFTLTQKHFNNSEQKRDLRLKITVMGADYVGLVIGAYCAEAGGSVVCYDSDIDKIQSLQRCKISVIDPDLQSLMARNKGAGRLRFTHDAVYSIHRAELIFITISRCSMPLASCNCLSRTLKNVHRWGNRCEVILVNSTFGMDIS